MVKMRLGDVSEEVGDVGESKQGGSAPGGSEAKKYLATGWLGRLWRNPELQMSRSGPVSTWPRS